MDKPLMPSRRVNSVSNGIVPAAVDQDGMIKAEKLVEAEERIAMRKGKLNWLEQ
jgi:hypothetical protein